MGTAIAIVIAVCGYGYWALVARPIANALYVAVGAWLVCRWRPGIPSFDEKVRSMVRFGLQVSALRSLTIFQERSTELGLAYSIGQIRLATTKMQQIYMNIQSSECICNCTR